MLLPANPGASYLAHKDEIDQAVQRVLDSGWYILGKEVTAFEKEFAGYVEVAHAVGVASGTDALNLALRACNVAPGDGVVTVAHTVTATVAAIEMAGAEPILVDIDPVSYTMDPCCLEAVVRRLNAEGVPLKAVIPVHLYGHPADMTRIMEVARRYGLYVIEDCAQAHGAAWHGRKTGTWGHLAAFSFYPTKNLGALGDGGAVVTGDPALAERLRLLREYGWRKRYVSEQPGVNSRLDELQAAVLRVKLRYLEQENARRRALAERYDALLAGTSLTRPCTSHGALHVFHQYVVRTTRRDTLRAYLQEQGIGTLVHYPVPIHRQPAYQARISVPEALEQTERAAREVISLPLYPELHDEQIATVARSVVAWERLVAAES